MPRFLLECVMQEKGCGFLFTFTLTLFFAVSAEEKVKIGIAGLARVSASLKFHSAILKHLFGFLSYGYFHIRIKE